LRISYFYSGANHFASSNLVYSEVIFLNKRSCRSQICVLTICNCPKIDGTLFGYSTVVSTVLFWLCPRQCNSRPQRDYSYFQRHLAAILQQLETWDKRRSMTDHLFKKYPNLRDNRTEIAISVITSTIRIIDPYSADLTLSAWVLFT